MGGGLPGIAALFAASRVFHWDPTATDAMFKDTAGATPATVAGDVVARINDQSGNGRNGTQATTANQPILVFNAGRPRFRFADSTDVLSVTLPAVTSGTMVVIGDSGIWIESGVTNTSGAKSVGTNWGLPGSSIASILRACGDIIEMSYLTNTSLSASERAAILAYGASKGAAGELVEGPERAYNWDFSLGSAGWAVSGADGTHIATFDSGAGTLRYQSDTTSPVLTVQQNSILETAAFYVARVSPSAWTSGSLQSGFFSPVAVLNSSAASVAVLGLSSGNAFGFNRGGANVDITITSVSLKRLAPRNPLTDNFASRSDGPLGTAISGHVWNVAPASGTTVVPYVSGGAAYASDSGGANTASYFSADVGAPASQVRATVSFLPGTSGGSAGLIANPIGKGAGPGTTLQNVTDESLHVIFSDTKVDVGYFSGGDRSRAGATAGTLTNVQSITYAQPMAKDGAKYTVGWDISGNDIIVTLPDGTTQTVTSAAAVSRCGPHVTFEHYWVGAASCRPVFHQVSAA